jgi:diketogulonate reductase-like aldo/keto reductase
MNIEKSKDEIFTDSLVAEIERLHEQVQDMINASGQECGCGYDKPNDVCLGHWPAYKKQQDKINLLTRKVEHLSKNKCMGCIDSICDDCATEEEYLSLVLGPGTQTHLKIPFIYS